MPRILFRWAFWLTFMPCLSYWHSIDTSSTCGDGEHDDPYNYLTWVKRYNSCKAISQRKKFIMNLCFRQVLNLPWRYWLWYMYWPILVDMVLYLGTLCRNQSVTVTWWTDRWTYGYVMTFEHKLISLAFREAGITHLQWHLAYSTT